MCTRTLPVLDPNQNHKELSLRATNLGNDYRERDFAALDDEPRKLTDEDTG